MDRFLNTPGKRIRVLREDLGMSQAELVEQLAARGVAIGRSNLSRIENADQPPSGELIAALAGVLGTSADYLLLLSDDALPERDVSEEDEAAGDPMLRLLMQTVAKLARSDQAMLLSLAEKLAAANQPRVIGGNDGT